MPKILLRLADCGHGRKATRACRRWLADSRAALEMAVRTGRIDVQDAGMKRDKGELVLTSLLPINPTELGLNASDMAAANS